MIFLTFHPHDKAPITALCARLHTYGMLAYYDLEKTFEDVHNIPQPLIIMFAEPGMDWKVFLHYLEMLIEMDEIKFSSDIAFTIHTPHPRVLGLDRFGEAVAKGDLA